MITVTKDFPTDQDSVFSVLADGWSYAGWVVGNSHIRAVDAGWPAVGTRIHHSVGAWPMQIEDVTTVVAVDPGRSLELEARLWRFGAAKVLLTLRPSGTGTGTGTTVVMEEEAVRGPARLTPMFLQGLALRARNAESLARLGDLAVGRSRASRQKEGTTTP